MPLKKPVAASQILFQRFHRHRWFQQVRVELLPIKRRRTYAGAMMATISAHLKRKFSQPLSLTLLFAMGQWQCVSESTVHFAVKIATIASPMASAMPATVTGALSPPNTKRSCAGRYPATSILSSRQRETLQQPILSTDIRGQLVFLGHGHERWRAHGRLRLRGLHKHQHKEPAHTRARWHSGCPTEIC